MKRPKRPTRNGPGRRDLVLGLGAALLATQGARAAATPELRIYYLRSLERHPTISLIDKPAKDNGLAGAELAISDNNTTSRLLNLPSFTLVDIEWRPGDDPVKALAPLAGQPSALLLCDLPAPLLLKVADAMHGKGVTVFNIEAPDDSLREADCRADIINVGPSRAMLADGLAQYLVWKKWTRWYLVYGSHPGDALLAAAYRRAAKRFGARIVGEKVYKDTGESRQSDSGIVLTQQQIPMFTQDAPDYDILVAADENQVFAGYLPYRTWQPRPVAGSAGLRPVSWDPASESWGGAQLQDRFVHRFHRSMTPLDMQAWTAVRMIGEASSHTASSDPVKIMAFMKGPDFAVAAYKSEKLTLRPWDWQLRQPILLSDGRTVVSVSPQKGFLHQVTKLDTLGFDRPETTCKFK